MLEFLDTLAVEERAFLIRGRHNRRTDLADGTRTKLFDHVRSLVGMDSRPLEAVAWSDRAACTAVLSVAYASVALVIPVQPRGEIRATPLSVRVLRVWDANPRWASRAWSGCC